MSKLVIFDIDRTIYDGSIFLDLSLHLIQKNIISPKFLSSIGFEFFSYQTGFESYDELVKDCLNYFHEEIKLLNPNDLKVEVRECLFKNNHKFYDYVSKVLKTYPDYDYMLISLEPEFVVEEVCKFLKIQNFAANKFVENNFFLNKLELIFDKKMLLEQTIFKDTSPFAVFGDSESDFPILIKSEHKFIINPTSHLQKIIKENNLSIDFLNQYTVFDEIKKVF